MKKIYALALAALIGTTANAQEKYQPGEHDNVLTVVAADASAGIDEYPLEINLTNPTVAIAAVSAYFYIDDNSIQPWLCEEEDGEIFYTIATNGSRCSRNSTFDAFMTDDTNPNFPHYLFVNVYEKKSNFKLTEGTIATLYIDATKLSNGTHTIHVVQPLCSAASADGSSSASYFCADQDITFRINGGTITVVDGIHTIYPPYPPVPTYDLLGRPIDATHPGLYIRGGKKVIR